MLWSHARRVEGRGLGRFCFRVFGLFIRCLGLLGGRGTVCFVLHFVAAIDHVVLLLPLPLMLPVACSG